MASRWLRDRPGPARAQAEGRGQTPRWAKMGQAGPQDGLRRPQDRPGPRRAKTGQDGLNMASTWPQDGRKMASIWPQDCLKMASRWPQDGLKRASRWPQDGLKMASRWPQDGLKTRPGRRTRERKAAADVKMGPRLAKMGQAGLKMASYGFKMASRPARAGPRASGRPRADAKMG